MIQDIVVLVTVFVLGFVFPYCLKSDKEDIVNLRFLWLYHVFFAIGYYFFSRNGVGDAWGYWLYPSDMTSDQYIQYLTDAKGTRFMYAFNYPIIKIFDPGYFANTLIYSFLGFVGMSFFYKIVIDYIPYNLKYKGFYLFPLLFFLPNLHFWSSGIGKDSLLFLCIGMVSYGILNVRRRLPLVVIGMLLSFAIRPHITLFIAASFGLAYLVSGNVSKVQRIIFSILLLGIVVSILPVVMEFAKIEEATIDSFETFSEGKAGALSRSSTGSAVDISSYPYPLKVLTFLYRPFFFDINGILAVVASFENLLLLLLSINVIKNKPIKIFRKAPLVIQALLLFLIIGTLAFSMSLGNLGIMLRMRNMFLPGMIIFILWSFSYQQESA